MSKVTPYHPYPLSEDRVEVSAVVERNGEQKEQQLTYRLFDHCFNEKWKKLIRIVEENSYQPRNGGDFYGKRFYKIANLAKDFQTAMDFIHGYIPDYEFAAEPSENLSREDLNKLHDDFEILKDRYLEDGMDNDELMHYINQINLTVHRYENCDVAGGFDSSHIQLLFDPTSHIPFEDEDYKLFTPDMSFGHLYLTYGLTGVPVVAAYFNKPVNPPRLQDVFTEGFVMYFGSESIFSEYDELEEWLQSSYGWTSKDPKITLGLIPLGVIEKGFSDKEDLYNILEHTKSFKDVKLLEAPAEEMAIELPEHAPEPEIKQDFSNPIMESKEFTDALRSVTPLSLEGRENIPAEFPHGDFIYSHLKLNSFIRVPLLFDREACLQEGLALADRFIAHRKEEQKNDAGQWKSLALQSVGGDPHKTKYHEHYPDIGPDYRVTEIADLCPNVMKMIRSLTDIDECQRIRFMMLEPGAKIPVHSDAKHTDVTMSMNIALNMPEGCNYWINRTPKGDIHRYTRRIPVQPGDLTITNIAKYHCVENNSDTTRLHIIINGPLRIRQDEIISRISQQTEVYEQKNFFIQELTQDIFTPKEDGLYVPTPTDEQRKSLDAFGLSTNSIPEFIKLLVIDRDIDAPKTEDFCLNNVTRASMYPLAHEVIQFSDLQTKLRDSYEKGHEFAAVMMAGTLVDDIINFVIEIQRECRSLELESSVIKGHIMNRTKELPFVPYLHEQFFILNLKKWSELDFEPLGEVYSKEKIEVSPYIKSDKDFHDGYTPAWIKGIKQGKSTKGKNWFGTKLIAKALKEENIILNFSDRFRATRSYAYPDANSWQLAEIKKKVQSRLDGFLNKVYFLNNEPLSTASVKDFDPDVLISLAPGLKSLKLLDQHWPGEKVPKKIIIFDYSDQTLKYHKNLLNCRSLDELAAFMFGFSCADSSFLPSIELIKERIQDQVNDFFGGDISRLFKAMEKFKTCEDVRYRRLDILSDPESLLSEVDSEDRVFFWHSNIWTSNAVYFALGVEEADRNYKNLVKAFASKMQAESVISPNNWESMIYRGDSETLAYLCQSNVETFIHEGPKSFH